MIFIPKNWNVKYFIQMWPRPWLNFKHLIALTDSSVCLWPGSSVYRYFVYRAKLSLFGISIVWVTPSKYLKTTSKLQVGDARLSSLYTQSAKFVCPKNQRDDKIHACYQLELKKNWIMHPKANLCHLHKNKHNVQLIKMLTMFSENYSLYHLFIFHINSFVFKNRRHHVLYWVR